MCRGMRLEGEEGDQLTCGEQTNGQLFGVTWADDSLKKVK